jgi:hypothetical protein
MPDRVWLCPPEAAQESPMTTSLASGSNDRSSVSGADRTTLNEIFAHPISHNLEWTAVVTLVGHLGHVEERSNDEFVFQIEGEKHDLHKPHTKHLTAPEVIDLRHFMVKAGGSRDATSKLAADSEPAAPCLIVVIDHHEASVYYVDVTAAQSERHVIKPYGAHHFVHDVEPKDHSPDHREGAPADRKYYELIAQAVAASGKIVVVGHGKGESNAGHQLAAYLRTHHPETHKRIVREIVADLPHLTNPQLLVIGRDAFVNRA